MITALITAYRRPHTMQPLVAALRAQTVKPDRIWAWANDPTPEVADALAHAGLDRIVTSSENTFFHARFALAMTAPGEFVALFDDDSIPGPNWFANCLQTMDSTPGILGTAGIVLHGPGYGDRTMHGWQRPSDETIEVDLVGQAWFLRRQWLPCLFRSAPVTGTNGEDIELSARAARLAGIRSFCPPHPIGDKTRWGSTRGLELGVDEAAASLRACHEAERDAIVKAEIAAGWLPLCIRSQRSSEFIPSANHGGSVVTAVPRSGIRENSDAPPLSPNARRQTPPFRNPKSAPVHFVPHPSSFAPQSPPLTLVYGADEPTAAAPCAEPQRSSEFIPRVKDGRQTTESAPAVAEFARIQDVAESARIQALAELAPVAEFARIQGRGEPIPNSCESGYIPNSANQGKPATDDQQLTTALGRALNYSLDPLAELRDARAALAAGGKLTAIFDNARHGAIVGALLAGQWMPERETRGRLQGTGDRDQEGDAIANCDLKNANCELPDDQGPAATDARVVNLKSEIQNPQSRPTRFFTPREIEKLFYRAGFTLVELLPEPCGELTAWRQAGSPGEIRLGGMHISGLSTADAEQFHARRYRAVAAAAECDAIANCELQIANCKSSEDLRLPTSDFRPSIVQRPTPNALHGLTSIVIPTFNQLAYTRQCLAGIRFNTDEPYELIVVDNGSTDGTPEYLASLPDVKLISNAENRGFPAACNQGIAASRGQYVLFLNNDVLVTTGWLRRMLEALADSPLPPHCNLSPVTCNLPIGLVGPCSNYVSGPQQVEPGYHDLACLDGWAWEHGKRNHGQRQEVDRLVGFCLLARRELLDVIGGFDARFGVGSFEDDDLCRRAIAAGWRCVIARDAYIHHFGHQTFAAAGVDLPALYEHNHRLYEEKWRNAAPVAEFARIQGCEVAAPCSGIRENSEGAQQRSSEFIPSANDAGQANESAPVAARARIQGCNENGPDSAAESAPVAEFARIQGRNEPSPKPVAEFARIQGRNQNGPNSGESGYSPQPLLSACMIVRNNENTIAAAVTSIMPWVDEVNVVDTGSTDRTPEICCRLGCRVYHFPWPDSFAVARNESLKHARGRWIIWIDSDDVIDAENGRKLRELLASPVSDDVLGFTMRVHCPPAGAECGHDFIAVDHCKVVRNRPDIRFEGRIHEQVLPSIRRAGGEVLHTPLFVVHAGADHTPAGRSAKLARDFKLLRLELRDHPDQTFAWFNMGMTLADAKKYKLAVRALERALAASEPGESHVRKIYALLVMSLAGLGRLQEATEYCKRGLELFPKDTELHFRMGLLLHDAGRLRQSELAYLAALANEEGPHFASLDRGLSGYKTRQNLAALYDAMGAPHKAEEQWRRIVAEVPDYRYAWQCLADKVLEQAAETGERLQGTGNREQECDAIAKCELQNANCELLKEQRAGTRSAEQEPPAFIPTRGASDALAAAAQLADELRAVPGRRTIGLVMAGQLAERRGGIATARQLFIEAAHCVAIAKGDRRQALGGGPDEEGAACGVGGANPVAEFARIQGHDEHLPNSCESGYARNPVDDRPLDELARFLFLHGTVEEAEAALTLLANERPNDAAARHNLAIVYLCQGRACEAAQVLRRSLELRPGYAVTAQLLTQVEALLAGGQHAA